MNCTRPKLIKPLRARGSTVRKTRISEAPSRRAASIKSPGTCLNTWVKYNTPSPLTNVTEVTPSEPAGFPVASLERAKFLPATRHDTPARFALPTLFDSNPSTYVKLAAPESDIDFIVEFPFAQPLTITGLEIDAGEAELIAPRTLEVMILPSGSMEGSGRAVTSFNIRPGGGVQKFAIPPADGKGAWIRIAGQPGALETIIGDLKIITTPKQ